MTLGDAMPKLWLVLGGSTLALSLSSPSLAAGGLDYRVYGMSGKREDTGAGLGFRGSLKAQRLKLEITEDFVRFANAHRQRLGRSGWYQRIGLNYLNERMYAPDASKVRISQYAGAWALGFQAKNDFLFEWGAGRVYLQGDEIGDRYAMHSEHQQRSYLEVGKRFVLGPNTLDIKGRYKRQRRATQKDPTRWGVKMQFYPRLNARISIDYDDHAGSTQLSVQRDWYFARYKYIDEKNYEWRVGLKFRYARLLEPKTWVRQWHRPGRLSLSSAFDHLVLNTQHRIRSAGGIRRQSH